MAYREKVGEPGILSNLEIKSWVHTLAGPLRAGGRPEDLESGAQTAEGSS